MRRAPPAAPQRQKPPPPPESSAPADRLPAASGTHLPPAMPGPAADGGKAPFRSAREDVRAGVGAEGAEGGGSRERPGERRPRQDIVWRNVVLMSLLHLGAVYSLLLIPKAQPLTLLWGKSRRRPLRPGRGHAGPPGLAGRLWRRAVRSPPRSPLASPRAPPLPGLRSSGRWDGRVFAFRNFLLLPPSQSAWVAPLPAESAGRTEGPAAPPRCAEAREGSRWARAEPGFQGGETSAMIVCVAHAGPRVAPRCHQRATDLGVELRVRKGAGRAGGWRDPAPEQS